MSSYYTTTDAGPLPFQCRETGDGKPRAIFLDGVVGGEQSPDQVLNEMAEQLCNREGIGYRSLEPIQRLFLTHYRCPMCKLLPLYYLDITYPKRVRCGKCGHLVSFTNSGKYGRLRKKLAFMLLLPVEGRRNNRDVP